MGPGWTSRLVQRILLELLGDEAVTALVAESSEIYAHRRHSLGRRLNEHGVDVTVGEGLNLWVPVGSEQQATVALAADGIGVSPGAPFRVHGRDPHIRVTATNVRSGFTEVAAAITAAADPRQAR